jgi:hypothetical protein
VTSNIPPKPRSSGDFEGPVKWLLGRQLISVLKWIALYTAFQDKLDARDWMHAEPITFDDDQAANGAFWFDYIADTGDSQLATYNVAYLCMSDLYTETPLPTGLPPLNSNVDFDGAEHHRLPRGAFLCVGGDTSYHIADFITLTERFQWPFWWAFWDLPKAPENRRPLFGIPGNHDHYDALDGFNRQFRKPLTNEGEPLSEVDGTQRGPQLSIPGFKRCQQASYVAFKLPFDWWFWGLDLEGGKIDVRQRDFFSRLTGGQGPKKLIVATPSPTTVFGKYQRADEILAGTFERLGLERPFLRNSPPLPRDQCRLDLSGDVHHYARYWGPRTPGAPTGAKAAPN